MFLFQKIEELSVQNNSALSAIADYILEDRERILDKSLLDVAQEIYTSKASVVRFAKALDFSGWKEFVRAYYNELKCQDQFSHEVDFSFPFSEKSSPQDIADNLRTLAVQTLDDTLENLDYDVLNRLINRMRRTNRIVIFCVSPHTYSAELFQRKMMSIQKPVHVVRAREMGLNARALTPDDSKQLDVDVISCFPSLKIVSSPYESRYS